MPRIPPLRYGGGVFFEADKYGISMRALRSDAQNKIAAQETPTTGYTMLEASANYRVYEGEAGALSFTLSASNILDQTARNHVSFTKDHVLLPGRSFRLVLDFIY